MTSQSWIAVAPDGDDTAGAISPHPEPASALARPMRNVQSAVSVARPGTTILVREGEYRENIELKFGTSYQQSEQTRRYLSYALDNERGIDFYSQQIDRPTEQQINIGVQIFVTREKPASQHKTAVNTTYQ